MNACILHSQVRKVGAKYKVYDGCLLGPVSANRYQLASGRASSMHKGPLIDEFSLAPHIYYCLVHRYREDLCVIVIHSVFDDRKCGY